MLLDILHRNMDILLKYTDMEIVTTMIKFRCRKETMMEQSANARIFIFAGKEGKKKVFVPKSKINVKDDAVNEDYNLCIMPKWAFMHTNGLPENVEIIEETQHMEIVNNI